MDGLRIFPGWDHSAARLVSFTSKAFDENGRVKETEKRCGAEIMFSAQRLQKARSRFQA